MLKAGDSLRPAVLLSRNLTPDPNPNYRTGMCLARLGQAPLAEAFFRKADVPWKRRGQVRQQRLVNLQTSAQLDCLLEVSDRILAADGGFAAYADLDPTAWTCRLAADPRDVVSWHAYRRRFAADWADPRLGVLLSAPDAVLPGAPLLIAFEENYGVGNMIFFSRWLAGLRRFHEKITIALPVRLRKLFDSAFASAARFVPYEDPDGLLAIVQDFEGLKLAAPDLPILAGRYGFAPTMAPLFVTYGVSRRREPRPRIGLGWWTPNPRSSQKRNIGLDEVWRALEPVAEEITFVSLQPQRDEAIAQIEAAGLRDRIAVPDTDGLSDYLGYVDLIRSCTMVVSIDSSIPFFAGACGVPTLLLQPLASPYGWTGGYTRSDSFSSVSYLRQVEPGDWRIPLARLADEIRARLPATGPAAAIEG
ncbi:hypothetical protein A6302_04140 [Methylobrevis pamukkalensis]|uniref:Glycosyltransferase family 9 (Heptosyltransferase) n=2 Tax=Methylobrevis pamukkalensis TaxID=1439726 RepID=A0A1E3GX22_9HYPH|nr:hypothetical protein A6302_04140 [Methylobrevis pamukkalensis]